MASSSKRKRGTCPVCLFRFPLLKDGITMQSHRLYGGLAPKDPGYTYCAGSGRATLSFP